MENENNFNNPYTCTNTEPSGDVELLNAMDEVVTTIVASRCFATWYSKEFGYKWRWKDGIDPEAPPPDE